MCTLAVNAARERSGLGENDTLSMISWSGSETSVTSIDLAPEGSTTRLAGVEPGDRRRRTRDLRLAAERVLGRHGEPDRLPDVGGREHVGVVRRAGDRDAGRTGGVTARPRVGEGDRSRSGPGAVGGHEGLALGGRAGDRRRHAVLRAGAGLDHGGGGRRRIGRAARIGRRRDDAIGLADVGRGRHVRSSPSRRRCSRRRCPRRCSAATGT